MIKQILPRAVFVVMLLTAFSNRILANDLFKNLDYPGCTNPDACNFDPGATIDDGTCYFDDNCIVINDDVYCFNDGDVPDFNVLTNDILPPGYMFGSFGNNPCLFIDPEGNVRLTGNSDIDCCGDHSLYYFITNADGSVGFDGTAIITIKCNANDCENIDLSTLLADSTDPAGGGAQGDVECIHVCEFSNTTFTFPYTPLDILVWDAPIGGSGVIGINPGEFIVTWGPAGPGLITLTVISNGVPTDYSFCIDIMDGPPAFFTGPNVVCLSQMASFTASSGADEYHWDFGDATYGTGQVVTHQYNTAGTYTITLTTTGYNYDEQGNPLCSCTSTYVQDIVVEDLPGPDILWVSTLCEGDFTKYWTTADCLDYTWTVNDFDGNAVTFVGNGNDTICVTWPVGSGPFGTVTLAVSNCTDPYCSEPTSVTVPIIPVVGDIEGEIVVCEGTTSVYSLPKWVNTVYNWSLTGNGTIVSANGGHLIEVMWGSAGVGHIHVDYHSEFLAGLPEHEGSDCYGSADLDVSIRPVFSLSHNFYSNTVCLNSTTSFTATAFPFTPYSWTITPALPFVVTGPNTINVDWNAPGNYTVTATPDDGSVFCNQSKSIVIRVIEVPAPIGIDGETSICLNTNYFFTAQSAAPGYAYNWSVSSGGVITGFGQTIEVQWTTPGVHWVSVTHIQYSPVYCESDPFILNVVEKALPIGMSVSGGALCSNSMESYVLSPAPDPEADIFWQITPAIAGSVIGGQGTTNPTVQWNNYQGPVTLEAVVTLCGVTQIVPFNGFVWMPVVPVIQQLGNLCPGVTATLQTTVPFMSYSWTPGGAATPSIPITAAGAYSVTTVDMNGCTATGYYTANNIDGPTANITSGDNTVICYSSPTNVDMVTPTNGFYIIEWWCNGNLASGPSPASTFTHIFQGNPAVPTYTYQVFVIDPTTGCEAWSDPFIVIEDPVCGGIGCPSQPYTCNILALPNCNQGQFTAVGSNFTVVSWSFGDGTFGGGNPAVHAYTDAGCYNVQLTIAVPNIVPGDPDCLINVSSSICIPLGVDFDIDYITCGTVDFTDLSSWIAGPGNAITSYSWNFGDATPLGAGTFVSHTYASAGVFNVTLTVTNGNGCVSSISKPVTITSVGIPTLNYSPPTVCVGEPVNFSSFAANAVTYTWDFGDGATFIGPNPSHTYTAVPLGGSATVTVVATDANGCTKSTSVTFPVNPAPSGVIFAPITDICEGDVTVLTAPPGFTYQWLPNNEATQSITVGGGTYSVILTNGFGCTYETDPVTIQEIPLPVVSISGRLIICDAGCVTLTATYGDGWMYEWYDDLGTVLGSSQTLQACSGSLSNEYYVKVTNAYGCSGVAGPVQVVVANSPVFTVSVAGTLCEGDPTTLTVSPTQPNWTYSWSGGGNLPVKVVTQLGNHTVTVTDIDSGCSATHTETVNPKPDFCAVPVGCYTACDPDTICGDPGMVSYQWNLNGVPIPGETNQCIIVSVSGTYTVTETNSFNCTDTSDLLILNMIDCSADPCDSLTVDYSFLINTLNEVDSCCATLSYSNGFGPLLGLSVTSSDASLTFSNVNPLLQIQSVVPSGIELASIVPGGSIPAGNLSNVITFCLTDVTSSPQEVIINWYDMNADIICPDTLIFNCPVEPDCLYLTNDTIFCDGVETLYQFTVCNPNDADWDVSYISLLPTSPSGITLAPSAIDLTGTPLMPGDCGTYTVALNGTNIGGEIFCFNIVAHKENPDLNPDALCCSIDTTYCIEIPFCDPCGFVHVAEVVPTEDCCYQTVLHNGFSDSYFDAIDLCVLSPQTTFTINNPLGSGWTTNAYTGTSVNLLPTGFSNFAPLGDFVLPEICIQTSVAPNQLVEVKWIHDGEVVCRDTLSLFCEPDCGYFKNEVIQCNTDGTWTFNADLVNTAPYSIAEAVITFNPSSGLSSYNQVISLGSLPTGGVFSPINFTIGAPAVPGDEVCFTVTLHEVNADGLYLNCCNFTYCMVLPDCGFVPECVCDESFFAGAALGITCIQGGPLSYGYDFNLTSNIFQDCDLVRWYFPGLAAPINLPGGEGVGFVFPGPGSYEVCAKIYRTAADGTVCKTSVCKTVIIPGVPNFAVFPNPNSGSFNIAFTESSTEHVDVRIYDSASRPVFTRTFVSGQSRNILEIDLEGVAPGIYYVQVRRGEALMIEKVSVN
ncbi:MAG: PKD domain-containing protein [Cryomorphaceae bacterium]|nr:PKD domain-containing protein [Cryomorphaceae bacterium]